MQAQQVPQTVDPNLASEQATAQQQQVTTLQEQAQGDTASLMARYGTKLALAGMSTPTATAANAVK